MVSIDGIKFTVQSLLLKKVREYSELWYCIDFIDSIFLYYKLQN
jgi:hypothetical protein